MALVTIVNFWQFVQFLAFFSAPTARAQLITPDIQERWHMFLDKSALVREGMQNSRGRKVTGHVKKGVQFSNFTLETRRYA